MLGAHTKFLTHDAATAEVAIHNVGFQLLHMANIFLMCSDGKRPAAQMNQSINSSAYSA